MESPSSHPSAPDRSSPLSTPGSFPALSRTTTRAAAKTMQAKAGDADGQRDGGGRDDDKAAKPNYSQSTQSSRAGRMPSLVQA